ncbi:MAG: FISUMP domain-containing protein [Marinifilaceae bacterium]
MYRKLLICCFISTLFVGCSKKENKIRVSLSSPEDMTEIVEGNCTVKWEAPDSSPDWLYDVYHGASERQCSKIGSDLKETSFTIMDLPYNCSYHWFVKAKRGQGEEVMSEIRSFRLVVQRGTFVDTRDHQEYNWIQLGEKRWMAENMSLETENGWWALENDEKNIQKYGRLYNWEMAQKVCPEGWHLPSQREWEELMNIPVDATRGKYCLLPAGKIGSNSIGFDIQPGGMLHWTGKFYDGGMTGWFWSSTVLDENGYVPIYMQNCYAENNYYNSMFSQPFSPGRGAHSVRCVMD